MSTVVSLDFFNAPPEERASELAELFDSVLGTLDSFAKEIRDMVITVSIGEETKDLTLSELMLNLLLVPARFANSEEANYDITIEDLISGVTSASSIKKIMKEYMDDTIEALSPYFPIQSITKQISLVLENVAKNAWQFNLIIGNSVNIYDILALMRKDKRVKSILNFMSNENSQFSEIETSVEAQTAKLIEILKSDEADTCLKNMLGSVSAKQFQQVFVNISLKPDLHGKIIEKPINTSFFKGMRDSTDYFINATGARKALIVNATQVRSAGYLARKLALLLITTTLDETVADCKSPELLSIVIDSKELANRYTNRYYKLSPSDKKWKYTTNAKTTLALVGKTIYVASPTTCCLPGNKICKRCYGLLSNINQYHIGMASVLLLTEQITQMLLSSKHLLQVLADIVELPEGLSEYFEVDKNSLIAIKPCKIIIDELSADENDPSSSIVTKLTLVDGDTVIEAGFVDFDLFMHSIKDRVNTEMEVDIKVGEEAFRLSMENNEISAPLKRLLKIIESEEELNSKGGFGPLVTELLGLLISSNIKMSAVGIEQIVRALGRDPDNIQERAPNLATVRFQRLTQAIVNSNSVAVSLAFERHKQMLESNIFDKHESSIIDNIF